MYGLTSRVVMGAVFSNTGSIPLKAGYLARWDA